jgi:hypothetical protein
VFYIHLSFDHHDAFYQTDISRRRAVLLVEDLNEFNRYMKQMMKECFVTFTDRLKEIYYDKVKPNESGGMEYQK